MVDRGGNLRGHGVHENRILSEIESEIINLNRILGWFNCPLPNNPLSANIDEGNVKSQLLLLHKVRQLVSHSVSAAGPGSTEASIRALSKALVPLFRNYERFAQQFGGAMEALKHEDENSPFRMWCKEVEKTVRQSLEGCLIVSVTLVPRLDRVLQSWLQEVAAEDRPLDGWLQALTSLVESGRKATVSINANITVNISAIRTAENRHRCLEIQARFFGNVQLEMPGRVYIREGLLRRVLATESHDRHFFLFNDVLVYATKLNSPSCLVLDRILSLRDTRCMDVADSPELTNAFQLLNPERSFTVVAESAQDKDHWVSALNAAIENPPGSAPSSLPPCCTLCRGFFTVVRLKYHCHFCGRVFCNECSSQQHQLPRDNPIPHLRLCDQCYIGVSLSTKYETSIVNPAIAHAACDKALNAVMRSVPGLGRGNIGALVDRRDTAADAVGTALEQLQMKFPFLRLDRQKSSPPPRTQRPGSTELPRRPLPRSNHGPVSPAPISYRTAKPSQEKLTTPGPDTRQPSAADKPATLHNEQANHENQPFPQQHDRHDCKPSPPSSPSSPPASSTHPTALATSSRPLQSSVT